MGAEQLQAESRGGEKWLSTGCCCIPALLSQRCRWYIRASHRRGCWVRNSSSQQAEQNKAAFRPPQNQTRFTDGTPPSPKGVSSSCLCSAWGEIKFRRNPSSSPVEESTWWTVWMWPLNTGWNKASKPTTRSSPQTHLEIRNRFLSGKDNLIISVQMSSRHAFLISSLHVIFDEDQWRKSVS